MAAMSLATSISWLPARRDMELVLPPLALQEIRCKRGGAAPARIYIYIQDFRYSIIRYNTSGYL
jgi:hypothetical protein